MITIKLFALLRDREGAGTLAVTTQAGRVDELLAQIAREYPSLAELITHGSLLVSVNQEFATKESAVRDGDEVALMPPFSGG
ncbi:MAG: hypothetical protein A2X56_08690 [Nitrospirae bacterium GWC2_57_13]|jgi:MoaD family protein|nr:MAG: hypothetical protein A2072_08420 [Nitrospirae bacterium GWC1_57_7]OGW28005.1 MAG: hypothetical protein A2X56_08690 [Nitrospirae bacterium GWC2_57_13]OGW43024.1 MAG: hypothetical protein A2X57_01945 [Nitrospirae bacterium GWD2_57_8]HAR46721.1 molybdopterin synthase sulfur carrier subunit [Nitrospiraceae bacterium]HAS54743.1 molybdopterin synthase sulfur carrier subunit [Nitrospiraceae bacterium]